MGILRNLVRNILFEIFDSHKLPQEYIENNRVFTQKNGYKTEI